MQSSNVKKGNAKKVIEAFQVTKAANEAAAVTAEIARKAKLNADFTAAETKYVAMKTLYNTALEAYNVFVNTPVATLVPGSTVIVGADWEKTFITMEGALKTAEANINDAMGAWYALLLAKQAQDAADFEETARLARQAADLTATTAKDALNVTYTAAATAVTTTAAAEVIAKAAYTAASTALSTKTSEVTTCENKNGGACDTLAAL
jgi:hypothetical protein